MKLLLNPIDRLFLGEQGYPIEMAFAFDRRLDKEWLLEGLKKLAKAWPLLNGVSRISGQETWIEYSLESHWEIEEVQYSEDLDPDDLKQIALLSVGYSGGFYGPLLKFKISHGRKYSWLTVGMAHYLGDGYSYFLFLKNLGNACRGEKIEDIHWERTLLKGEPTDLRDNPVRITGRRTENRVPTSSAKLLRISKEEAAALILPAQEQAAKRLSLHDCLCAQIWKDVVSQNALKDETPVRLNTPVDFRRFRKADLGYSFLGNAIHFAGVNLLAGEVRSLPLGMLAAQVHQTIRSISADRIQMQISTWEALIQEVGAAHVETLGLIDPVSPILVTNISSLRLDTIRLHPEGVSALAVRYLSGFKGLYVVLPTLESDVLVQYS